LPGTRGFAGEARTQVASVQKRPHYSIAWRIFSPRFPFGPKSQALVRRGAALVGLK
jgi:hypothetical protein